MSGTLALGFVASDAALEAAGAPTPVTGVVDYLARINMIVFAFNLVPALPLDGGRLLHAYLWDTAAPYDDEWHRSPGNIMTLWAELLEIGSKTRHRLIPLRTDLVKLLTERGL